MKGVPPFVRQEVLKLIAGIVNSGCDDPLLDRVAVVKGYMDLLEREPQNEGYYEKFCIALTDLLRAVHERGLSDIAGRLSHLKDQF